MVKETQSNAFYLTIEAKFTYPSGRRVLKTTHKHAQEIANKNGMSLII